MPIGGVPSLHSLTGSHQLITHPGSCFLNGDPWDISKVTRSVGTIIARSPTHFSFQVGRSE